MSWHRPSSKRPRTHKSIDIRPWPGAVRRQPGPLLAAEELVQVHIWRACIWKVLVSRGLSARLLHRIRNARRRRRRRGRVVISVAGKVVLDLLVLLLVLLRGAALHEVHGHGAEQLDVGVVRAVLLVAVGGGEHEGGAGRDEAVAGAVDALHAQRFELRREGEGWVVAEVFEEVVVGLVGAGGLVWICEGVGAGEHHGGQIGEWETLLIIDVLLRRSREYRVLLL